MTELVTSIIERYINGAWDDITDYIVGDYEIEYLIPRNLANDLLAQIGTLKFVVNNESGLFSPNVNFQRGTRIRIHTTYDGTTVDRFKGLILSVDPDTLEWGDQYVRVTVVDWMHTAVSFPITVLERQDEKTIDEAVAHLLTLLDVQPESVTYHGGRETFEFVFDTIRKETKLYTELQKLALSEFAPIYLKAGNNLVIESADTRHGMRELTKVPVNPSNSPALLVNDTGYVRLTNAAGGVPLLVNRRVVPNFASGTHRQFDVQMENGLGLANRVSITAYPSRTDSVPVLLYKLSNITHFPAFGTKTIRGTWANPNGGGPINAFDITPIVTGTHYRFEDAGGTSDQTAQLLVLNQTYGAKGFEITFQNTTYLGFLHFLEIYGYGIYPYNPYETVTMVTGSASNYGVIELKFDQKYQEDFTVAERITETIADDEKEPRNRLMSISFDASMSPELMQASQHMDIGDLTWVMNVKPSLDTYAYIQGKKLVVSPAGWITETWYLKEMDSVRKGLQPVALRPNGRTASQNGLNFGAYSKHGSGGPHTWCCWVNLVEIKTASLISKTDWRKTGANATDFFMHGAAAPSYNGNSLIVRRAFEDANGNGSAGVWQTASGTMTGLQNAWHHVAMVYDDSGWQNDPLIYLDGVSIPVTETATPTGTAVDYSRASLILGNVGIPGLDYTYNYNGYIKDARIYNRLLTQQELLLLASDHNTYTLVPEGMIFQGPFVKTEDYIPTGTILYSTDRLIDNIYGVRGTPHWNTASGTSHALKYYAPNF